MLVSIYKYPEAYELEFEHEEKGIGKCPEPCSRCRFCVENACRIWWWVRKTRWELRARALRGPNGFYKVKKQCSYGNDCDQMQRTKKSLESVDGH